MLLLRWAGIQYRTKGIRFPPSFVVSLFPSTARVRRVKQTGTTRKQQLKKKQKQKSSIFYYYFYFKFTPKETREALSPTLKKKG